MHLPMRHASLVLNLPRTGPEIVYFGARLDDVDVAGLAPSFDWPAPEAGYDSLPPIAMYPEAAAGYGGAPGIAGRRHNGNGSAPRMRLLHTDHLEPHRCRFSVADDISELQQEIDICADPSTSVVTIQTSITNTGSDIYELDSALVTIPVDRVATELMWLTGRWSNEFRPVRHAWECGTFVIENRRGRTSHDRLPFLTAGSRGFTEEAGEVWAAHVGWSGNSILRAEVLGDGRRVLQAGELLLSGEVSLEPGEHYDAPPVFLATSNEGLNGTSAAYHRHLRARPHHPSTPRPVLLNTWEAVYFNHDFDTLKALADRAARVGVERFVLDDGWFHGRRSDKAGLGDWWVDTDLWADGLAPLIDHVTGHGMEFGIWMEPEMVNPDSDLFRNHPDWALTSSPADATLFRNQLPVDLSNPAAFAYLLELLDSLLVEHDISFVKWDMNRDLAAPDHEGRAAARTQTLALYRLLDELRSRHPDVEIESCSSGGGRADFGILERTDRIWSSDCNDPVDRQRIQRGFSYLFPPELMGAHIGPHRAHTTGRVQDLAFRAATAIFGHLGIEWNLLDATSAELDQLTEVIEIHKELRLLLHGGQVRRLDHPDESILAHVVIAADQTDAVVSAAQLDTANALAAGPLRVTGLVNEREYEMEIVGPLKPAEGKAYVQPAWSRTGTVRVSGRQLAVAGIQLPILHPSTALVAKIRAVS